MWTGELNLNNFKAHFVLVAFRHSPRAKRNIKEEEKDYKLKNMKVLNNHPVTSFESFVVQLDDIFIAK